MKTLFFGRQNCKYSIQAFEHLQNLGFDADIVLSGGRKSKLTLDINDWVGDYIFCFRSLFVVPKIMLDNTQVSAINFHPAPPEYPGSGCINFALYDQAKRYGVTAHEMNEKIDDGRILKCSRYPIQMEDSLDSLLIKTHRELLALFIDITSAIKSGGLEMIDQMAMEAREEKWAGPAKKISELDKLLNISPSVSEAELMKLIRATYTKKFPPKIVLHGYTFELKNLSRE